MIVLDTNVIVSGVMNPVGTPGRILALLTDEQVKLACDDRILAEYHNVLGRSEFGFDPFRVDLLLIEIDMLAVRFVARPLPESLPDPTDNCFLEVAIAAQVEHLVTGNLKHYPPRLRCGVKVVSPAEWWEQLRGKGSR